MKAFERRQEILNVLRKRHTLKVTELAESFGVSQGTIRSDLDYLSQTEQVTRIRGGATLLLASGSTHPPNNVLHAGPQTSSRMVTQFSWTRVRPLSTWSPFFRIIKN
jgi:DeoR/GlpR family transcriptional regulator of sugar metabolism